MRQKQLLRALVATLLAAASSGAFAQQYPAKPIRFIVPFAPGGGTDIVARLLGVKLNESLKQPVVVDNRGGAGSTLGTELAAKSPPDGYTIVLNNIGLAFNATLYKDRLGYDTLKDLAPVSLVATQPNLVVVHPSLPVQNVAGLIGLARSQPGKVSYASAGPGSGAHLAAELFKQMAKVDLFHIPYKGTGPALSDLLGGQVQMMISTFASALPHVRNKRLRALAVTDTKRAPAAPEVPTVAESGVKGYEFITWYGVLVPAGTPAEIVKTLNTALVGALGAPDIKEKFVSQGLDPVSSTPEHFSAYLKSEIDKWAKVVKAARLDSF